MKVAKHKIWVEAEGEVFLGNGRIKLLQAVADHGSITAAAKSMNMSYKKAWEQIDQMNAMGKTALVETSAGGAGGGGAHITEAAKSLIIKFNQVNEACADLLDEMNRTIEFE